MPPKASKKKKPAANKATRAKSGNKFVYLFGKKTEGNAKMRNLLGGKGANLAEMAAIGLPVPPGFTATTEVCTYFYENKKTYPKSLEVEVKTAVAEIEKQLGKTFGDKSNPLLFAVRSGSRESMPGMMDTILNLGLNDATCEGLAKLTDNAGFAYDCYRRFIHMYGSVVMGVQAKSEHDPDPFDHILEVIKKEAKVEEDSELTAEHWQDLVKRYKVLIKDHTGTSFPQDPWKQLWGAVGAVFSSWQNERAILYRQKYNIPANWGTAVNVQAMVFGNMGEDCATGVAFTRDPANGEKVFYGEYLMNAQGEDVVAGVRTPKAIAHLAEEMPQAHRELERVLVKLERHFRDMQDFEFTVEKNTLYMLQTRNGKRTGLAAVRIAVEMNREKLMKETTAVQKIPADSIDTLLVPIFDVKALKTANKIGQGLPAGPGAASGHVVFTADAALRKVREGKKVVLCRTETSPEDLKGMIVAEGIMTSRGGVSSHAALVARQMGKVCVCGASSVKIDYEKRTVTAGKTVLKEGDYISIDGTTGAIYQGAIDTADSEVQRVLSGQLKPEQSETYQLFNTVMQWADKYRTLGVRTNADSPEMAKSAVTYGAEGIGLCRTEHMFFEGERIDHMREMILAGDEEERRRALKKLLPYQRNDFKGLFKAMEGRPVTIRLLDPPLHEFLPHDDTARRELAERLGVSNEVITERLKSLHEQNPMLGHRGCRLGITYPEITEMQARAIFEAAASLAKLKKPIPVQPEVMIPLIGFTEEFKHQAAIIHAVAKEVMESKQVKIDYTVGTMIEIPRAALIADEIAEHADFFSFGTNDLTQTALGLSRDDMGGFYDDYKEHQILNQNPFASLDQQGVGKLVTMAANLGRNTKRNLKLGICGEHGGDPNSIEFFHQVGLNYVSCSPPRVPVARLAAAQAALKAAGK